MINVPLFPRLQSVLLSLHFDQLSWELEPALEEGENFYSSLWLEFDSTSDAGTLSRRGLSGRSPGHGSVAAAAAAGGNDGCDVCRRFQIFSRQAPLMNAMITRCVDECDRCERERPAAQFEPHEGTDLTDGGGGGAAAGEHGSGGTAGGPVFVPRDPRS